MTSSSDPSDELATLIGTAIGSAPMDRRELAVIAQAVVSGPCWRAERFGRLIAQALAAKVGAPRHTPAVSIGALFIDLGER